MILNVDLSTKKIEEFEPDAQLASQYIGGRGIGARFLWQTLAKGADALSGENPLMWFTGPLSGTGAPSSGRLSLTTKSPLTSTIFDANCGGIVAAKLKGAGYSGLIVNGRADSPVYLSVTEDGVEIKDAGASWGLDVESTRAALGEIEGKNSSKLCVGPAGEHLVRFASIMVDGDRAFGRGGVGAVMGSKKLKAIVIRGRKKGDISRRADFDFFAHEARKLIKANPVTSLALPKFGTAALVNVMNRAGTFPSFNFKFNSFDRAEDISGEAISDQILVKKVSCHHCQIACGRKTRTARASGKGPEYETVWALGANLGISDLEAIAELNYLCNSVGLDTISMGGVLATAMELTEAGAADFPVRFGSLDGVKQAIKQTAHRKGFGSELAEGSKKLAERYGRPEAGMQIKGQELPAYDPRTLKGQGLGLATSNRGGCHLRGNMLGYEVLGSPKMVKASDTEGKAGLLIVLQHLFAALDSLIMCKFSSFALNEEHYARLLSAATGRHTEAQELLTMGERIWNLERLFNLREGFGRQDDALPARLLGDESESGKFDEMLEEYYRFRNWTNEGVPTNEKLDQLGLLDGLEEH